ncbi:hypothetical protein BS17DRAFT_789341 [Gyrodon lividus]|nr:hypothetical protein BS17DRAFT_789341 [Gyrodon lividus]
MSDEYGNNGRQGSRVNSPLENSSLVQDTVTRNYPPPGDTTSSRAYDGPDTYDPATQRGANPRVDPKVTLLPTVNIEADPSALSLQQSTNGTDLRDELEDAKQGVDRNVRRAFQQERIQPGEPLHPATRVGMGRNAHGQGSLDSRVEAEQALRNAQSPIFHTCD